jgi:two-component system chemotaxis response regulator CheY
MSHRVLIADDAAYMREMLRDILSQGGYEVAGEASDGDEAVQAYREHSPDLVTLDIVMPRKSGLDALREIMALDPGACVIICSALGQEALVKDMMNAGAKGYLVKPFKPDQVLEVVGMVMGKKAKE